MSLKLVVALVSVFVAAGEEATDRDSRSPTALAGHPYGHGHATHGYGAPAHHGYATHGYVSHVQPVHYNHHNTHGYHGHHGGHGHSYKHKHTDPGPPACSANTTKTWCLEDSEYPLEEIRYSASHYLDHLLTLYADVVDLNTALSVDRPKSLPEETYLCPSQTAYVKPLRAINTDGKWRTIVNNIYLYHYNLTQTTRVEECLTTGSACPLVPNCYVSMCLQKSVYHRFLVYDSYDHHFPFAIETFKLPSSCACYLGAYVIDH